MFQGKGKKRAVGWFPASYVKLLAGGEATGSAEASAPAASNGAGKDESFITSTMSALAPKSTLI